MRQWKNNTVGMGFVVLSLMVISLRVIVASEGRPNFLIILTDDQDVVLNGMMPMEKTQRLLANEGVTFANAFTSSPICCPSRASLLSGQYAHNHRTTNNSVSGGCYGNVWKKNVEPRALPVLLKAAGYETFYAGKYLNEYNSDVVPPGWDHWFGLNGNSEYYNYTLTENGVRKHYETEYLTDLLNNRLIDFLENNISSGKRFFAMVSPPAPHAPFTPARRHSDAFRDINLVETPNLNLASGELVKHWLLRMPPAQLIERDLELLRRSHIHRWQTLLAVDELVATAISMLSDMGKLNETFVILTSDNGFHLGQFAQGADKRQPYETDIRVPLVVRGPEVRRKSVNNSPVILIDLAPTILELAGSEPPEYMDGQSFAAELIDQNSETNSSDLGEGRQFLIEYWGEGNENTYTSDCSWSQHDRLAGCSPEASCHCQDSWNNTYTCLRQISTDYDRIYCEFNDNESFAEAYDLTEDPYQMDNLAFSMLPSDRTQQSLAMEKLSKCAGNTCWRKQYVGR